MAKRPVESLRNIAFCGHSSAGKTTIIDHLLVMTGAVSGHHDVDDGTSVCDFDAEEKHHKHTVEAKLVHFEHGECRFNVIDTPGYPDFIGQTIGALYGVDTAVIVLNAHAGVEVNARRVFAEAGRAGLGRILLVNKMDADNVDFPRLVNELQDLWGPACVPLMVPIGQGHDFRGVVNVLLDSGEGVAAAMDVAAARTALIESIIEVDESIMERYLEGSVPSNELLVALLARAVAAGTVVPILCCAAKSEVGLRELLAAMPSCCPSPEQHDCSDRLVDPSQSLRPDPQGPVVAHVFKTRSDPFLQQLSFLRVFSGTLQKDGTVHATALRKGVKLAGLLEVMGHDTRPIDEAGPGEIVALAKHDELHTGMVLGDIELRPIPFPTPMVGLAVHPKTRGDEAKLSVALHKIVEEDPTFRLDRDAQTKELVMTGMSELHLAIIRERLHRRDKLDVEFSEPKIPYRETIQMEADGSYRHKKQSGGRGQFGEVHLRIYPFPRSVRVEDFLTKERFPTLKSHHFDELHHFLWVDTVVGGSIPGNFMPAIEKGFKERLAKGVIAGYQIQDLCVEVYFGKHHPVDSSEAAFKTAASLAFRNVFQQAKPSLLEPVVKLAITVPDDHVGEIYSDMSGRRGRVIGSDAAGGRQQTVHAEAPLAEVANYARMLSGITGGQGSYTMEFSHYDVVPPNVQQEILAKAQVEEEEEEG